MLKRHLLFMLAIICCFNLFCAQSSLAIVIDRNYPGVDEGGRIFLSGEVGSLTITENCTVKVEAGKNLKIDGNLELINGSIVFLGNGTLKVEKHLTMKNGGITGLSQGVKVRTEIAGNVTLGHEESSYDSGSIAGEVRIGGDLLVVVGSINSIGQSYVKGNTRFIGGFVRVSGEFVIHGDLTGANNGDGTFDYVRAQLSTVGSDTIGKIVVLGNAKLADCSGRDPLTSFEVKGDIDLLTTAYDNYLFDNLILSADIDQRVNVASDGDSGDVKFGMLVVKNTSATGVSFSGARIACNSIYTDGAPIHNGNFLSVTLESDVTFKSGLTLYYMNQNGHSMTVEGDIQAQQLANAKDTELIVQGDVTVSQYFTVNGNTVVQGSLALGYVDLRVNSFGRLMVTGDIIGSESNSEFTGGGTVEVKGDFLHFKQDLYVHAVPPKLILSGDKGQRVEFDGQIFLKRFENNNSSSAGVQFVEHRVGFGEFIHNCRPCTFSVEWDSFNDTDFDGQRDNVDAYPEDPTRWEPEGICLAVTRDFDKDGMDDGDELKYFGNASQAPTDDYDQDGLSNAWELKHGFDPINFSDAAFDIDGDGYTNLQEFLAGTDPKDPASVPTSSTAFNPAAINLLLLN